MNAKDMKTLLSPATAAEVRVFPSLASTNTTLREWAEEGAPHGAAVIAEAQTAGRGRLGRSFASPEGAGLYMSVLLRTGIARERLPLLTPSVAVIAAEAIEALSDVTVGIKWVNDLWIGSRKIAGILTEGSFAPGGELAYAIVGIGINLRSGCLPPELDGIAAAIGDFAPPPGREALAAAILDRLLAVPEALISGVLLPEYRRRSVVLGREVTATDGSRTLFGVAREISDDGSLLLDIGGETVALRAGEVSVRM